MKRYKLRYVRGYDDLPPEIEADYYHQRGPTTFFYSEDKTGLEHELVHSIATKYIVHIELLERPNEE